MISMMMMQSSQKLPVTSGAQLAVATHCVTVTGLLTACWVHMDHVQRGINALAAGYQQVGGQN